MSDWQVGDRAFCLKGALRTKAGAVYTVKDLLPPNCFDPDGYTQDTDRVWLRFHEIPHPKSYWADSNRFTKLRPYQATAEDEATIRELNGQPVRETV